MGLFDFIKGELIEVIDWVENDKDTMCWKFPDADANIKYGAQLTVRESQLALFLDEGEFADVYEPGRTELVTRNMPLLTSLRNWDKGFKSPFLCDVYFFSTRTFTGLNWGTANPIILRDPQFKQVRVKAFGTYFIKISDVKTFFTEFGGTKRQITISEVEEALRDIISPRFAECLAEAEVSVLDMVSNYTELGEKIAPMIQADLDKFGVSLEKFVISSTSLPKEVEDFYDKMTNMNMVENMNKYQQFQMSNAMEKAAENPNGGGSEGMGMGMGFGMANMMVNQNQQQQNNNNQPKESKDDIMKTLKELGELFKADILTKEEFETKKKELLARL